MLLLQVIYVGLDIVTPLISLDLLKYPKLSRDVSPFEFFLLFVDRGQWRLNTNSKSGFFCSIFCLCRTCWKCTQKRLPT